MCQKCDTQNVVQNLVIKMNGTKSVIQTLRESLLLYSYKNEPNYYHYLTFLTLKNRNSWNIKENLKRTNNWNVRYNINLRH